MSNKKPTGEMYSRQTRPGTKEGQWERRARVDVQTKEELLGDAQQAGPNGHDQQTQSTEHMDGEI